ncbi:hypothetical protein C8J55DRAFT_502822 [Lentinula edodes]|uniref:Secreted protein n=1 Tax=Lentinula lateritia TaxID=40482 RepID=A0A9W9DYL3_9AGAR|nr:hypothetical protein C8J55DRAFT_502822 [Lentinula edodes]
MWLEILEGEEGGGGPQTFIVFALPLALAVEFVDARDCECEDSTKTTFLRREGGSQPLPNTSTSHLSPAEVVSFDWRD